MTDAKTSKIFKSKLAKLLRTPESKSKYPLPSPPKEDSTSRVLKHKGQKTCKIVRILKSAPRLLARLTSSKPHLHLSSSLAEGGNEKFPPVTSIPPVDTAVEDDESAQAPISSLSIVKNKPTLVLGYAPNEAGDTEKGEGLLDGPISPKQPVLVESATSALPEVESASSDVHSRSTHWCEETATDSSISSPFDDSCDGFPEDVKGKNEDEAISAVHDSGVGWSLVEGLSSESDTSFVLENEGDVEGAAEEGLLESSSAFHDALRELASNHELRFEDIVSRLTMFKKITNSQHVLTSEVHFEEKKQRCLVDQAISLYEMPSQTEVVSSYAIRPLLIPPYSKPTPSRIPVRAGRRPFTQRYGINGAASGDYTAREESKSKSEQALQPVQRPQLAHDCGRDHHRRRVTSTVSSLSTSSSSSRGFDVPTQGQYLAARRAGWRL
ncbi:hypothetical protein D9613_011715 [Agrocybe pediades]|uniref:Uncharacterized protein n=1 Tax=Agrocybe pediades TaxID=84607 RepID=A0A8H4QKN1_9AGAR|nr:hypothetical protein D9613_011715 [Agrocybe pediades]